MTNSGFRQFTLVFIGTALALLPAHAQTSPNRYAVFLRDDSVAARVSSRAELQSAAAAGYRRQIETAQLAVKNQLDAKNIQVTGSVSTLLNAIFVIAPAGRVAELSAMPGVAGVVPLRRRKAVLNRATQLINGAQAWNLSGGFGAAGKGIKIAILDTGVDQNHPALQDSSLSMPPGFPKCNNPGDGSAWDFDCSAFTNTKVIVAKSYIRQLAAGTDPKNPAADSRPDDYSPRDRIGHGTATASTAAGNTAKGAVSINGMAPKAWIGNYRIIGSPEVNDGTIDDVMVLALEDAVKDGMDIISLSVGAPALSGPLDTGAICGNPAGIPCDVAAFAFEAAAQKGATIIVAAGNSGEDGYYYPTFNSIGSPADAPGVIAVGASTNSHVFVSAVSFAVDNGPATSVSARTSDSSAPDAPLAAPVVDVTSLGDNGLACSPLPGGSLSGKIALIQRGSCTFAVKLGAAVDAGAAGVIFYMADGSAPINPSGLSGFRQPALMIGRTDGLTLKGFVTAHQTSPVTMIPEQESVVTGNQLAGFSSMGPSTDGSLKPEVLAVGTRMYMPTQSYDPLGEMYSTSGFIVADGTSFATPLTAGAAALVKQRHPEYTASQIKSALVTTATQDVTLDDSPGSGSPVNILQTGGGKVAADLAIQANVTANPSTISFGVVTAKSFPVKRQLQIGYAGTTPLSLAIVSTETASGTTVSLDKATLAASGTVTVTLDGTLPAVGVYSGALTIQGGTIALRIPWMYLVGGATATNIIPLSGDGNGGTVGQVLPDGTIAFKLTDDNGAPVAGAPVSFKPFNSTGLSQVSTKTDAYGIASAVATLGPTPGNYSVIACAAPVCSASSTALYWQFTGTARNAPAITAAGVVDAASFRQPIAPGSYIAIFGTGLSDTIGPATTARLPLAINRVNVSFDVPSAGISVPGRLAYASPGQLVVQVPWELRGQKSAQVKVTIDFSYGNVVTIPLSDAAPAFFESSGIAIAVDGAGKLVTAANPAVRGQVITFYANGLGPVNNQPASGEPAPSSPLATTVTAPAVTIGGQPAAVSFSGLTPTLPGLYQLNVTVPPGIDAGTSSVSITIAGQTSKTSTLPVK